LPLFESPGLRVALGLGDQELEQRFRPALEALDDLVIVAQCLAADQLLQLVTSRQVDAIVVAWSLHRLTDALLDELDRPGVTLVLLVADPADERWGRRSGPVLALNTAPEQLYQAILDARPGVRAAGRSVVTPEPVAPKPADRPASDPAGIIAVAGAAGSPGRTTLAINLATALGAAAPTVLADLDLCAPATAAYVDADPSRNVCTLAHAVRDDPRLWGSALSDELQPLGSGSTQAVLLCGPPKREMRASLGPGLVERLVEELAKRFRWVILDIGPELVGIEVTAVTHRAAVAGADRVLLVGAADFVGLWHTRTALDQLERLLGIERRRVNLILNRHDARFHHSRQEVEWHLGAPVVAVIPFDHSAQQRAIAEQRPAVLNPSSRSGRAILEIAQGMHEGRLRLPAAGSTPSRGGWWRRLIGIRRQPVALVSHPVLRVERHRSGAMSGGRSKAW
jgi:Flp pilus assembly CpaE family ATPase